MAILVIYARLPAINQRESPMSSMNISLPRAMKEWVEAQGRDGNHSNSSDHIRGLIRKDRELRLRQEQLAQAIDVAEASGTTEQGLDAIWARVQQSHPGRD